MMNSIKGFFGGSGLFLFNDASVIDKLLALVRDGRKVDAVDKPICVAYIGTATYDLPAPMVEQTELLSKAGCKVHPVRVADPAVQRLSEDDDRLVRQEADLLLVSGGNTLYAVRRWEETGLNQAMRAAAERQAVLAGGSAGAICWFTAGHSDSADPSTYVKPSIKAATGEPLSDDEQSTTWSYIRVHGLNFLPGLVCPHFDKTQSNGIRREADFSKMMKRHPTEHGIGIDHCAVLILKGNGEYEVFAAARQKRELDDSAKGSESDDGAATTPSVFGLDVENGELTVKAIPRAGKVADILKEPKGPVCPDPFERFCAMQNPTPSSGSLLRR